MVADVRVTGANDFKRLAADLRAAGERGKGLRKELYQQIDKAVKPLQDMVKRAEGEELPKRGGFAKSMSSQRISVSKRNVGNNAGVRLYQRGRSIRNLQVIDSGRLRHPLFGDREHWYTQDIKPGVWSETLSDSEAQRHVQEAVIAAVDEISRRLT